MGSSMNIPFIDDPFQKQKKNLHIKTGSIVLMSGRGFASDIVKVGTQSCWSHVGVILNSPNFSSRLKKEEEDEDPNNLYMLHAYPEPLAYDLFYKSYTKTGVQLHRLTDVIKNYKGNVFIRLLRENAFMCGTRDNHDPFSFSSESSPFEIWLFENTMHKSYEKDYLSLPKAQIDIPKSSSWWPFCGPLFQNKEDISSYFCSELVRKTLYQLFPIECAYVQGEISAEWTPANFAPYSSEQKEPRMDTSKLWEDYLIQLK